MKKRLTYFALAALSALAVAVFVTQTRPPVAQTELRLRLQWVPQSQFAGYLVADKLGFYKQEGLTLKILPAGPDLKPLATVASGSDDIGIGVANQVISARAEGVPLKIIAQIFQDSANRYVLKSQNRIMSLAELKGKKVGLWRGGDEAEFISMLSKVGLKLSDMIVVPQEFSVAPFLQDQYILSEVTIYNELIQIQDAGYSGDKLQVLTPSQFDSNIVADMIFTTDKMLMERRDVLVRFLRASLKGWRYAIENPEKAVEIVMSYNKELSKEHEIKQLRAVSTLILHNLTIDQIGLIKKDDYVRAYRILQLSNQISRDVNIDDVFDRSIWAEASRP